MDAGCSGHSANPALRGCHDRFPVSEPAAWIECRASCGDESGAKDRATFQLLIPLVHGIPSVTALADRRFIALGYCNENRTVFCYLERPVLEFPVSSFTLDRRNALGLLGAAPLALAAGRLLAETSVAGDSDAATMNSDIQEANWTGPLARYVVDSRSAQIPEDIRELARRHLLDSLAAAVACRDLEPAALGRRFATAGSGDDAAAPVLATLERRSVLDAVFASGMTVHSAEINDFCPSAFTQPGAAVVPVVMCLGSARGVDGEAALRALIAGYEVSCRLPKALGIRNLIDGALANHSVGPLFGSAVAAASLIGLDEARFSDLFSYCVQQASGSWQWLRDIEHVEKAFTFGGMPARRGVECALLVESGFTGMGDPFVGTPGWLNSSMFRRPGSDFDADYLTEGLGERFELPLVGYKRYPVGGPTQPVIELMLDFIEVLPRHRIRQVRIEMPGRTGAFAVAQMPALNLPYLCAIIIADGRLDFVAAQSRQRFLSDTTVHALMDRVEVVHDPAQEASPRVESARVILTLEDGSRHERFLDHVKGFPAHPFDRQDVEEKAMELTAPHLGLDQARALCETVWRVEKLDSVDALVALIAR